jgi:hypothetical protein
MYFWKSYPEKLGKKKKPYPNCKGEVKLSVCRGEDMLLQKTLKRLHQNTVGTDNQSQ